MIKLGWLVRVCLDSINLALNIPKNGCMEWEFDVSFIM